MKRFFALSLSVWMALSGCQVNSGYESAVFYYIASDFASTMSAPVRAEEREITGHSGDLTYLLQLYLMGPSQEGLDSPLPAGCQLLSVDQDEDALLIKLSDTESALSEAAFSLACACLTLTVLDVSQVETVTVSSGNRKVTMDSQTLTLYDSGVPAATEESQ